MTAAAEALLATVLSVLVCPRCRGKLEAGGHAFVCQAADCHQAFPVVDGVPILIDPADYARERTVVIVAHRAALVEQADKIVVLEDEGIVEEGSHAPLLARDSRYASLYRLRV